MSQRYLLQIEPLGQKSDLPVDDDLTAKMEGLLESATIGTRWRGWHTCCCGEFSGTWDLLVDGFITNSLAAHYLRHHRQEVPISEIDKLTDM